MGPVTRRSVSGPAEEATGRLRALLPPGLPEALAQELPSLAAEIITMIAEEIPPYARPLEGSFGRGVRLGVQEALRRFIALLSGQDEGRDASREVYVDLGRGEVRQGRSLEVLLAAYRVGARVAWRRLASTGTAAGLGPEALVTLAEAMFAYIDELSAASAEGFALEQSLATGERDRRRASLARLLIDPVLEPAQIEHAARVAGWVPPRTLAAVLVPNRSGPGGSPASAQLARLHPDTLVAPDDTTVLGLVPDLDGPGRLAAVRAALSGQVSVIGPVRPTALAWQSFHRARLAMTLVESGALTQATPLVTEDVLAALVLCGDAGLVDDLATRRLAPLQDEPDASRERLAETLLAWLSHRGERAKTAAALHIHPQTVRYRMGRLRDLFGAALDDPDTRFELELVLRARGSGAPGRG